MFFEAVVASFQLNLNCESKLMSLFDMFIRLSIPLNARTIETLNFVS